MWKSLAWYKFPLMDVADAGIRGLKRPYGSASTMILITTESCLAHGNNPFIKKPGGRTDSSIRIVP